MPIFDMPLEELRKYRPSQTKRPDFDRFWDETLALAADLPLNVRLEPVEYPAVGVRVFKMWYEGWDHARICGWYLLPEQDPPFPALVQYHGYSGNKGEIYALLPWILQGYAVLALDVRGQSGESTDPTVYSSGHVLGWMTQGILDEHEYYYRGVFVDCIRALDALATRPEIDMSRVGVMGISQGGGLTLAVAALDHRPILAMPEVPYLCHYRRAVLMAEKNPYLEFADYLRRYPDREERVFRTLTYFDNLNLADRIRCPVLITVGLQDTICPPSTIFAVYNHLECEKEIKIYPYHDHDGGRNVHWEHKFRWARRYLLDGD